MAAPRTRREAFERRNRESEGRYDPSDPIPMEEAILDKTGDQMRDLVERYMAEAMAKRSFDDGTDQGQEALEEMLRRQELPPDVYELTDAEVAEILTYSDDHSELRERLRRDLDISPGARAPDLAEEAAADAREGPGEPEGASQDPSPPGDNSAPT